MICKDFRDGRWEGEGGREGGERVGRKETGGWLERRLPKTEKTDAVCAFIACALTIVGADGRTGRS